MLGSRQRGPAREAALKRRLVAGGILPLVLAAPPVLAERLVPWRVMVAGSLHFGEDSGTADVRAHAGYVHSSEGRGPGSRLFVGLGVTAATGRAVVKDPRGLNGSVSTFRWWVGPELRLGASWMEKEPYRAVDFYLALAPIRIQAGTLSDRLPEAGGAFGLRTALGVAMPRSWATADLVLNPKTCDGGTCAIGLLLLLLPNTLEASYERSASANRGGVVVGYTF